MRWSNRNFTVDNVWEGDRYFIVSATNLLQIQQPCRLIFDRRDLVSGGFSATGSDGKPGLFIGGIVFTPCYIRDNRIVGYMQALDIADGRDAITDPRLKALAAILKEDSNPVIVVASLK
jgi:hypothetical protein